MPSTVVHVGLAALIAAALLRDHFDTRSLVIVMATTAFLDIDTILGMWIEGGHRAILHNIWIPVVLTVLLAWDTRVRPQSILRARYGDWGVRTAWVSIVAITFAHILLDAFYNGVNLFWPLHDQFYDLSGHLWITDQRGLVQTFVTIEFVDGLPRISEETAIGSTSDVHYRTGVDPGPDADPDTERIFPIAESGELFIIAVTGYLVAGYRLFETHILE